MALLYSDVAFPNCHLCDRGQRDSIRLTVRNAVDVPGMLFHAHVSESLHDMLIRLCHQHSDRWTGNTVYYFYIDMGGIYHVIEDSHWLRDRDSVIISDLPDVENLPQLSMNAIHASLRPEVKLRPHQEEGVDKMIYMERAFRGGILADEMGLGKTLQMLVVIMRQQPKLAIRSATLVVVPSRSIADQWGEEIRSKTTFGSLPYLIYQQDNAHLLEQTIFRVVITTYAQIRTEYKKQQSVDSPVMSLLYTIDWHRIILDESHQIRTLKTQVSDSVLDLKARFKWCVTGTPLQNEISELYPLCAFLGIPLEQKLKRNTAYMTHILQSRMIRRTKESLSEHLMMMPKSENRVVLEFSAAEKALYDYLERLLYIQIKKWKSSGDHALSQRASALIYLRLKQVCGHHKILLDKFPGIIPCVQRGDEEGVISGVYDTAAGDETRENDTFGTDEGTELNEVYGLMDGYYEQFPMDPINMSELLKLPHKRHSTKMEWLIRFLRELLNNNRTDKVVIVSQFIDLVEQISKILHRGNIRHYCYHGGLTPYSRKTALRLFNHEASVRVLIMTLKAGGVGLNLQAANHMIIMDRWWNPATMDQAIARIHRMTQFKQTYIHTVVIKDTIEEGLMDNVLHKKNELFKAVVEAENGADFIFPEDGDEVEVEEDEEEVEEEDVLISNPEERRRQIEYPQNQVAEEAEQTHSESNGDSSSSSSSSSHTIEQHNNHTINNTGHHHHHHHQVQQHPIAESSGSSSSSSSSNNNHMNTRFRAYEPPVEEEEEDEPSENIYTYD